MFGWIKRAVKGADEEFTRHTAETLPKTAGQLARRFPSPTRQEYLQSPSQRILSFLTLNDFVALLRASRVAASGRAFDFLDYLPTPACVDDADDFRRAVELWAAALEKGVLSNSGVSGVTLTPARLQAHAVAVLSQRGDLNQVVQLLGIKTASTIGLRKKAPPRGALYNPLLWGARHYHTPAVAMETLHAARTKGAFLPTDTWNMILGAVCPSGRPEDIVTVLLAMEASGTPGNLETIKHMTTARSVLVLQNDAKPQRAKTIADARATLLRLLTLWAPAFTDMDAMSGGGAARLRHKESFTRERIRGASSSGADSPVLGDRKASLSARPRMSATTREVVRAAAHTTSAGGSTSAGSASRPVASHAQSHAMDNFSVSSSGSGPYVDGASGSLGLTINLGGSSGMTAQALADALVSSLASVQQQNNSSDMHSQQAQQHPGSSEQEPERFVSLAGLSGMGSSTGSGLGLTSAGAPAPVWGDSLGLAGESHSWSSLAAGSSQQEHRNLEQEAGETAAATAEAVWDSSGHDATWDSAPSEAMHHGDFEAASSTGSQGPFNPASSPWSPPDQDANESSGGFNSAAQQQQQPQQHGAGGGAGVDPMILQRAQQALEALMQQGHAPHRGSLASTATGTTGSVAGAASWGMPPSGYASSGASHVQAATPLSTSSGAQDPMQVLHELRAALASVGGAAAQPQGYPPQQHNGGGPSGYAPPHATPYMQAQHAPAHGAYQQHAGPDSRPMYQHGAAQHYAPSSHAYGQPPMGPAGYTHGPMHGTPPPVVPGPAGSPTAQWDGARSDVSRGSRGSRGSGSGGSRSKNASANGSVGPRDRGATRGSVLSGTSRASKTSRASRSSNANDSAVSGRSGSSRGSGHNSPRKLSRKQIGLLPTPPAAPHLLPGGTNPMLTPARARMTPTYGRHHATPVQQHNPQVGYQPPSGHHHPHHQGAAAPQGGYDPPSSYHTTPPGRASIHSVLSSEHSSDRTVRTGSTSTSRASFTGMPPGQQAYGGVPPAMYAPQHHQGHY